MVVFCKNISRRFFIALSAVLHTGIRVKTAGNPFSPR
jgi:hypothetical protein